MTCYLLERSGFMEDLSLVYVNDTSLALERNRSTTGQQAAIGLAKERRCRCRRSLPFFLFPLGRYSVVYLDALWLGEGVLKVLDDVIGACETGDELLGTGGSYWGG